MKECSELATIQTFNPFDIVYGKDKDRISPVHIVLSGQCSIIQFLNMNVSSENGCERGYILQSPKKMDLATDDIIRQIFAKSNDNLANTMKDLHSFQLNQTNDGSLDTCQISKNENLHASLKNGKAHFVEIGEFSCGSIFGLGEHMDDRVIVAKHTPVQCLLIPHYSVFQKNQNAGNIWQRTKIYLDFTLPSRQQVFEHYLIAKKWKIYKKNLIRTSQRLKPQINSTIVGDIPIICRLNETF